MGATNFRTTVTGLNARAAFDNAASEARAMYGNCGYTGTIAEKNSFQMIRVPAGVDPRAHAHAVTMDERSAIYGTDGPAGCIDLGNGEYLFFGWARE